MSLRAFILGAAGVLLAACGEASAPEPLARVVLDPSSFSLQVGDTLRLRADLQDASGRSVAGREITWATSQPSVATVSASGTVTALAEGPVTVTATAGGQSGTTSGSIGPSTTVTAEGRTLTSADGRVTLDFPSGAVAAPLRVSIEPSPLSVPPSMRISDAVYRFGPSGSQFSLPVRLTIRYDSIPAALAEDASFLWPHRYTSGAWTALQSADVDTLARTISADLTGFSDYAALISELAEDVRQLSNSFFLVAGDPVARNAFDFLRVLAGVLAKTEHPLFLPLVEPVLDVMSSTACSSLATAVSVAQSTTVDEYEELGNVLAPVHTWTKLVFEFTAGCEPDPTLEVLHTQKFTEFTNFYVSKLSAPDFTTDFERLLDEVGFLLTAREGAQLLALTTLDLRLRDEAYIPLLIRLRESAYGACQSNGVHRHLGQLRQELQTLGDVPYGEQEILRDLQECATRMDWALQDIEAQEVGTGTLGGGDAPGSATLLATAAGIHAGTFNLAGSIRAFRCSDGSLAGDELVIRLAGTEIRRLQPNTEGEFLVSPIEIDMASAVEAAGLDPAFEAVHPLEIFRSSLGCGGAYVGAVGEEVSLGRIDLSYPSAWSYTQDFSGAPGSEWSRTSRDTSPSGETYLGRFLNESVSLTLAELPPHTQVRVEMDLYVIRSWDGNSTDVSSVGELQGPDVIELDIEGVNRLTTTFSNVRKDDHQQAYPDGYPGGSNPAGTGALATNALGYTESDPDKLGASVYRLAFEIDHSMSTLTVLVRGLGLQSAADDEWWGLDNVRVVTR